MTRERVYYIYDDLQKRNLYKRLDLDEAQKETRKLNARLVKVGDLQEGETRYEVHGGWVIHKLT